MNHSTSIQPTNSIKSQIPQPSGQVSDQLDKLQFALDSQYDIIQSLLRRLEPVTGNLQYPAAVGCNEKTASSLVPIAERIQQNVECVLRGNTDLDRILSNMQI